MNNELLYFPNMCLLNSFYGKIIDEIYLEWIEVLIFYG